jgi:glycosyltransferase involved in cell wall biosynthesis
VVPAPTGTSGRVLEYVRALSQRFEVVVLSIKPPHLTHLEKLHGARLLRVPVGSGDFASRLQAFDRAVRRQLESEEYLLAHVTDPFAGTPVCELRDNFGYRLIYDAQAFPSAELDRLQPDLAADESFVARVRRSELFCLMKADRVLCGSEVTRAFVHSLGVAKRQVDVVRAPVDVEAIPFAAPSSSAGRLRVTYVGSDAPWQGLPTLLRAIAIASRDADVRLSVIGPVQREAHEPQLRRLGLQQRVEFHPPVPGAEVAALVARGDAAALPLEDVARNRGPGGPCSKVADYLAAGRAVVASDLPLAREMLAGDAASFHAPGDADALGAALVELAWDPKLRAKMGAAARDAAHAHHDARGIHQRLLAVYVELVGDASLRPAAGRSTSGEGNAATRVAGLPPAPTAGDAIPALAPSPYPPPPAVVSDAAAPRGRAPAPPPAVISDGAASADAPASPPAVVFDGAAFAPAPGAPPPPPAVVVFNGAAPPHASAPSANLEPADHTEPAARASNDVSALEPPARAHLDPWFAHAVHGYCPPDAEAFARPTPPTNFPGRDGPPPATVQPSQAAPSFTPRTTDG